jgi:hypothetical protein
MSRRSWTGFTGFCCGGARFRVPSRDQHLIPTRNRIRIHQFAPEGCASSQPGNDEAFALRRVALRRNQGKRRSVCPRLPPRPFGLPSAGFLAPLESLGQPGNDEALNPGRLRFVATRKRRSVSLRYKPETTKRLPPGGLRFVATRCLL